MSLHAPSHVVSDNSEGCVSSDNTSEVKRQIQFMDEKETVLISRLVDVQKERVSMVCTIDALVTVCLVTAFKWLQPETDNNLGNLKLVLRLLL